MQTLQEIEHFRDENAQREMQILQEIEHFRDENAQIERDANITKD